MQLSDNRPAGSGAGARPGQGQVPWQTRASLIQGVWQQGLETMRENVHLKYETKFSPVSNSREPQETWLGSPVVGIGSRGHKEVGTHGEKLYKW